MQRIIETPPQITPKNDNGYLEELTKAIFRAGFSWQVVRLKWDNFRLGFDGFDVDKVAAYDQPDIARLMNDSGIVRNRRKILATIENAQTVQALSAAHGSFQGYLRSLDPPRLSRRCKRADRAVPGIGAHQRLRLPCIA